MATKANTATKRNTPTKNYYDVNHVVEISTDKIGGCEHCSTRIGEDFAASVNHYIDQHGYKLLHIGTVTSRDDRGAPWHSTVAVMGK